MTKIKLKVKEGTHNTSVRIRVSVRCTVPIWVTKAFSPLGKWTKELETQVIELKTEMECTIWSMAHALMIRLLLWKADLLTNLALKTMEFGMEMMEEQKTLPEKLFR